MLKLTVECDVEGCGAQILSAVELQYDLEYDTNQTHYDLHATLPKDSGWRQTTYGQHRCKKHARVP